MAVLEVFKSRWTNAVKKIDQRLYGTRKLTFNAVFYRSFAYVILALASFFPIIFIASISGLHVILYPLWGVAIYIVFSVVHRRMDTILRR